jgi:hypothetical protein
LCSSSGRPIINNSKGVAYSDCDNTVYLNAFCVILRRLILVLLLLICYRYKSVVVKLGMLLYFIAWGSKVDKNV